jgi:hypothetical protein
MRTLLTYILVLIALPYVLYQVRKPTKWAGRLFALVMNLSHIELDGLGAETHCHRKELHNSGCGLRGGRTIEKLAVLAPEGIICGVDYADGSVAVSCGKNARFIEAGRVEIQHASVSCLPFPGDKFDLVTAVETHYDWPRLVTNMQRSCACSNLAGG